jgi:hypothetical protein
MSGPGSPLWPKTGFPPGGGGGGGGGISGVVVQNGGAPLPGTFTTINFTGDGISATAGLPNVVDVSLDFAEIASHLAGSGLVANGEVLDVSAAIQLGAAAGLTAVQDVVEMYGEGAGRVQGVPATPGWTVLEPGGFMFSNALSDTYVQAFFRAMFLVTDATLTGSVRLFDVTAGIPVATSVVSSSSLTDVVVTSADILGDLVDGHLYQFQAEAAGAAADAGFIFVRSATLICQL